MLKTKEKYEHLLYFHFFKFGMNLVESKCLTASNYPVRCHLWHVRMGPSLNVQAWTAKDTSAPDNGALVQYEVCSSAPSGTTTICYLRDLKIPLCAWLTHCLELRALLQIVVPSDPIDDDIDLRGEPDILPVISLVTLQDDPKKACEFSTWHSVEPERIVRLSKCSMDFYVALFISGQSSLLNLRKWLMDMLYLRKYPSCVPAISNTLEECRFDLRDLDASFICSGPYRLARTLEFEKHLYLDEDGIIYIYWDNARTPGSALSLYYGSHPVWAGRRDIEFSR